MSTTMEHVIEVTDETFERTVIEGSSERPVVVDLWAEWCGPCRTLGPMLEKVAAEREGAFLLAKVDIDANSVGQSLLQAVRSQGIPTVVAFRDAQPVSMFIGAYPEEEVNRFIDSILPTGAELEAKEAERPAGTAPLGPQVDDDGPFARTFDHGPLEGLVGHFDDVFHGRAHARRDPSVLGRATGAAHHPAQRLDPLRLFPLPGQGSVVPPV